MPDSQPPPKPEIQPSDTGTAQYAGAFFPRSERLLISGGVFTSNVTHITQGTPPLSPDFRMIPMGDIYLRHGVDAVIRSAGTNCARRVYSARIEGKQKVMTVAMYQGDDAEKEWRDDLSKYMWLRHPNFLQIYGVASFDRIHAIILHDELISWDDFTTLGECARVHMSARVNPEWEDAVEYFDSVFHEDLEDLNPTGWIDRSIGRLCIDVVSNPLLWYTFPPAKYPHPMAPGVDSVMLLNEYHRLFPPLTPEQYHSTSYDPANTFSPYCVDGPVPPIHLASILWSSEGPKAFDFGDANNPVIIPINPVITYERRVGNKDRKTMANGWERYESKNVAQEAISLYVHFERPESWLSQANYIFDRLNVTCNKNYALVDTLKFTVFVEDRVGGDIRGYLFVCPSEDFRLPGTSSLRWPDCPAYWSFDPTGAERLSTEAAMRLGFSALRFRTRLWLTYWDDDVYAGLREFHESRGFNPDSQDMLRDLGYIIYKVADEEYTTDDEDSCDSPILALRTLFADTPLRENTVHNLSPDDLATPCQCGPEDFIPLSRTSKFIMAVKFALILFIAVSSAYNGV